MPVAAVALGVAAAAGVGGSLFGSKAQSNAINEAARSQALGANGATDTQMQMFDKTLEYQQPYNQLGLSALPLLDYYSTGKWDPLGAARASGQIPELAFDEGALSRLKPITGNEHWSYIFGVPEGAKLYAQTEAIPSAARGDTREALGRSWLMSHAGGGYDPVTGKTYVKSDIEKAKAALPQLASLKNLAPPKIEESPYYKWQSEQALKTLNRQGAARGLLGSGAMLNRINESQRALGAEESQRQYGRLLDLVNIGRGAATTSGNAALTTGNTLSNIQMNNSNNQAQLGVLGGQNKASLYSNLGSIPMNMLSMYTQGKGAGAF